MSSNRFLNADGVYSTRFFKGSGSKLEITILKNEVNRLKNNVAINEEIIVQHQDKIDELEPIVNNNHELALENSSKVNGLTPTVNSNTNRIKTLEGIAGKCLDKTLEIKLFQECSDEALPLS